MNGYRKKLFLRPIIIIVIICLGLFFISVYFVKHSEEQRVKLSVRTVNGTETVVYLKSNGDIVTISESPDMKLIGDQDNIFESECLILYLNTIDTLYIVSFTSNPSKEYSFPSSIVVKFLFEYGYNPELIFRYKSLGYCVFPTKAYI